MATVMYLIHTDRFIAEWFDVSVSEARRLREAGAVAIGDETLRDPRFWWLQDA